MSNSFYAVVLAGGSGTRFWPLSRRNTPKQLLHLLKEKTMLEETVSRLDGLVPPENIIILTNTEQERAVRATLPSHPAANIVAEPAKRDTAPAIALGVGMVAARDPGATMAVLAADAMIENGTAFQSDLRIAAQAAEERRALITIGIKPTWACPGYGYIERGNSENWSHGELYEVVRFREKPAVDLAEVFWRSGNFFWNAGIFVWTVNAIVSEFNRHTPRLAEFVAAIRHTTNLSQVLAEKFAALPRISVDYAVMEKASRVLVKPASFDWDDVGGWNAVAKYLGHREGGNVANCALTLENSANNIVFSDQKLHVALLGVNDLVVVQTKDAILVCNRHEVENLKTIVGSLPDELQ